VPPAIMRATTATNQTAILVAVDRRFMEWISCRASRGEVYQFSTPSLCEWRVECSRSGDKSALPARVVRVGSGEGRKAVRERFSEKRFLTLDGV